MNILYGITGGVAAYKAPDVVRRLRDRGHAVRCVLTANGAHLVASEALIAVSGQPVANDLWVRDGSMPHIDLARWCEALLVAPLSANSLARFALGLADDLLSTLFLALEPSKRVVLAPAMNTVMWNKPIVQQHLATLRAQGAVLVGPVAGTLACGETGLGAMASPDQIADAI